MTTRQQPQPEEPPAKRGIHAGVERVRTLGIEEIPSEDFVRELSDFVASMKADPFSAAYFAEMLTAANLARQSHGESQLDREDFQKASSFWEWLVDDFFKRW